MRDRRGQEKKLLEEKQRSLKSLVRIARGRVPSWAGGSCFLHGRLQEPSSQVEMLSGDLTELFLLKSYI